MVDLPIEPENAASTGSVRPGQGHNSSWDGLHKSPQTTQWTPPPRTKSASLLTQALATTYEVDESSSAAPLDPQQLLIGHPETQSSTAQIGAPLAELQHHNGMRSGAETANEMAVVVPMSLDTLRTSFRLGDRPTSTSPVFDNHDFTSLLGHDRDFLGTAKVRGTSLERTAKEKRVQDLSGGFYSTNPGDTGMVGDRPPPHSPTSPASISSNPPTDGMRAQYRSWRDVRPGIADERTWSIDGQGRDSGYGGQVEKSIGEALAGVEPNSRSRKASHSLGLFKEGLPDEKSNSRDSSNASRFRDANTHSRALSAIRNSTLQQGQEFSRRSREVESTSRPDWRSPSNSPFEDDGPSSRQSMDGAVNPTKSLVPDAGYFDASNSIETIAEDQIRQLPSNLLAEIRKYHNLTPGAAKGSSFSGSIPVPTSEKLQKVAMSEQTEQKPTHGEEDFYDGPGLVNTKSTDEGNDSGEEQVFRALFVPHQSTHQVSDRSGHGVETELRKSDVLPCLEKTSQQWLEEHKVSSHDEEQHAIDEADYDQPSRDAPKPQKLSASHDDQIAASNAHESSLVDTLDLPLHTQEASSTHGQYVHDHQLERTEPLFAIELKPYRHQVGGHTTMWKFSKRAVCKLLNNRENEFYERIERHHPQLLNFMPRYIGVLNVTYRKERRKSYRNGDSGHTNQEASQSNVKDSSEVLPNKELASKSNGESALGSHPAPLRMISQSLDAATEPVPTVTFADNRHIIPSNFLMPRPQPSEFYHRARSDSLASSTSRLSNGSLIPGNRILSDRPTTTQNPWGKTNVNKQLRNEVFKDAFLAPIPIQPHKKPASNLRPLPGRPGAATLRSSNSESSLKVAQQTQSAHPALHEDSIRKRAMKTAAEQVHASIDQTVNPTTENGHESTGVDEAQAEAEANATADFDGRAGTSAPESEMAHAEGSSVGKRQRRYSSGGLRRRPNEVAEDRGDLKYFEEADEAGYKGDNEDDVFAMDPEPSKLNVNLAKEPPSNTEYSFTEPGTPISASEQASLPAMNKDLPRPVNPKEARAQPDQRSEYFLLLEDLTCDMKRPCVMDLKMGTRQYGVEANEKKQNSQRRKCAETTSKQLGVRVCGVQVWDVAKQDYVFQDKYSGRNLKAGHEFQEALTRFLYNGVDYCSVLRHIPTILEELSQLELLVKGLVGYRFYAASLLMFYDGVDEGPEVKNDGDRKENDKRRKLGIVVADFANCVTREDFLEDARPCPPRLPDMPDNGFLRGLRSLRRYFKMIQRDVSFKMGANSTEFGDGQNKVIVDGMDEDDEGNVSY